MRVKKVRIGFFLFRTFSFLCSCLQLQFSPLINTVHFNPQQNVERTSAISVLLLCADPGKTWTVAAAASRQILSNLGTLERFFKKISLKTIQKTTKETSTVYLSPLS